MEGEQVRIELSPEELMQLVRLAQNVLIAISGARLGYQPIGPFTTVENRCKERWPLASKKAKRRIRDVCLGMFREAVGREPYKMNGCVNATYVVEMEYVAILDRAIDTVRNEAEERERTPLFSRRPR